MLSHWRTPEYEGKPILSLSIALARVHLDPTGKDLFSSISHTAKLGKWGTGESERPLPKSSTIREIRRWSSQLTIVRSSRMGSDLLSHEKGGDRQTTTGERGGEGNRYTKFPNRRKVRRRPHFQPVNHLHRLLNLATLLRNEWRVRGVLCECKKVSVRASSPNLLRDHTCLG